MQILKYSAVGVISTIIHLLVALVYIYFINNSIFYSNIIAFLVAYFFSYTAQSKFVFKSTIKFKNALFFFIVQFASLIISILVTNGIEQTNHIKTIFIVILMPFITFILHKFWTFRQ